MAEESDLEKTEPASARRLEKAREEGNVARSRELTTLAGCLGHVLRYRCPAGLTMVAHSAGRLRQGLRERWAGPHGRPHGAHEGPSHDASPSSTSEDFLSGESGTVGGLDAVARAVGDETLDAWAVASGQRLRLRLAARRSPARRRVLVRVDTVVDHGRVA